MKFELESRFLISFLNGVIHFQQSRFLMCSVALSSLLKVIFSYSFEKKIFCTCCCCCNKACRFFLNKKRLPEFIFCTSAALWNPGKFEIKILEKYAKSWFQVHIIHSLVLFTFDALHIKNPDCWKCRTSIQELNKMKFEFESRCFEFLSLMGLKILNSPGF